MNMGANSAKLLENQPEFEAPPLQQRPTRLSDRRPPVDDPHSRGPAWEYPG